MKFSKVRDNAKSPVRAHTTDAGMDVFFCGHGKNMKKIVPISPADNVVLPTGLSFEVPPGWMLEVKNKSSIASKLKLVVGACVIDSGYAGEVYIDLHNIGHEVQYIKEGQKIAQLVLVKIETPELEEVPLDDLNKSTDSERGDGGFGSTGET